MNALAQQKCVPCEGGVSPLNRAEAETLLAEVPLWELNAGATSIRRAITFKNFKEALAFLNEVGDAAEHEGHHPDLHLTGYKHVAIELSTHSIGGLSRNDFIVAAKISEIHDKAGK